MHWRGYDLGTFILGTAQLGMSYGFANRIGQPSSQQSLAIVSAALDAGVTTFDTAQAYGDSERCLGEALSKLQSAGAVNVITKMQSSFLNDRDACLKSLQQSRQALGVQRIFALFAHSFDALSGSAEQSVASLQAAQAEGITAFGGVSVYTAEEALAALSITGIDIVQMPLNVLDRSALKHHVIEEARRKDKLLNFRSAYLQGFLTMQPDELPDYLQFGRQTLADWLRICAEEQLSPAAAALQAAAFLADGFPLVIGAESAEQVQANAHFLSAQDAAAVGKKIAEHSAALAGGCERRLINPALWQATGKTARPAS